MEIKQRITFGKNNYYIKLDCIYKKKNGSTHLCLKNYILDYYDGGDLGILIKKLEANYKNVDLTKYGNDIYFLRDCLYIYEHIPFISGIGDIFFKADNTINEISYITKEELDNHIFENNILLNENKNFRLYDERTWNL